MADVKQPRNPLEEKPKDNSREWPLAFRSRVTDATMMLLSGHSEKDVVEKHGSAVLGVIKRGPL